MTPTQAAAILSVLDTDELYTAFRPYNDLVSESLLAAVERGATVLLRDRWSDVDTAPESVRVVATHRGNGIIELGLSSTDVVPFEGIRIQTEPELGSGDLLPQLECLKDLVDGMLAKAREDEERDIQTNRSETC